MTIEIRGTTEAEGGATDFARLEEQLRASEDNFHAFFDAVDDIIVVGSSDGRIVHANRAALANLGYSTADLLDLRMPDLYPRDRRTEAETALAAMLKGSSDGCSVPLQTRSGDLVPVETRAWPGRWDGAACVFSVSRDLVREQEALQMFDRLFRANPAPMALTGLPDGTFVDVNEAFVRTLGYASEEIIGHTSKDLGLFVGEERRQRAVAAELTASGHVADQQLAVTCKDGTVVDGLFSGELIEQQGRRYLLTVMIDQTERKRSKERLAAAARQWRETFDAMTDSVALFDAEGKVLRCNAVTPKLTGRAVDDIIGRRCHEVFHGTATFPPECPLQRALVSGATETSVLEQDGRWLRATFQPLTDETGHVHGGVHVVTDVSELKHAEQELRRNLALQTTVTRGVIAALGHTIEARDPYTAGHQRRVGELAAAMATHMGLGDDRAKGLRVAGMLHDVGKIIVPAEILARPGRLTETEFELIKSHTRTGFEILRPIHFPWPVAEVALRHHERLDGSGYPDGLSGDEILLEARVLAVADVIEAMASHRPYRSALGTAAALDEVRSGAGSRYDADAAAACEHVFAEGFVFTET